MPAAGVDNPTINSSIVRYDSNCRHKPRGSSKSTFSAPKGYCPRSRLSAKFGIDTHNFTNDDLTDANSPSYHSNLCQFLPILGAALFVA